MHKFLKIREKYTNKTYYINTDKILHIQPQSETCFIVMDDVKFDGDGGVIGSQQTVYHAEPEEVERFLGINQRVMDVILVERGETKNSSSPMWRMYDADQNQINVFQHEDADKNTFPLFSEYAEDLEAMAVGETVHWYSHPIKVQFKLEGKWRTPVLVAPRAEDAQPDVLPEVGSLSDLTEDNEIPL